MTKRPDYQWGSRDDRAGKNYLATFALEDLLDHRTIVGFARDDHRNNQFFFIDYGDGCEVPTAVSSKKDVVNGGCECGIEGRLIVDGMVKEVLLLCGDWDHYYRIPVHDWIEIVPDHTSSERYVFVVNGDSTISKSGRDVSQFQFRLARPLSDV
jgi:hypothetical protein